MYNRTKVRPTFDWHVDRLHSGLCHRCACVTVPVLPVLLDHFPPCVTVLRAWVTVLLGPATLHGSLSLSRVCHVQVENWFRHIDVFARVSGSSQSIFSTVHWTVAVVDLRNGGRLGHLDSLSSATDAGTTIEILRRFIVNETELKSTSRLCWPRKLRRGLHTRVSGHYSAGKRQQVGRRSN